MLDMMAIPDSPWVRVFSLVIAYLVGAIPTGYLVVKKLTGEDIRQHGSGNTGATNVKRVAGKKAFIFVLLFDFFKGFVPVLLVKFLFPSATWLHVGTALATVLGHSKSIFLGFSGGKSAATGLGGIFALQPFIGLILAVLAFTIIKIGRMVSVGSITAAIACPLLMLLFGAPQAYVIYASVVALYVIYLHKTNISRLLQGTENRI